MKAALIHQFNGIEKIEIEEIPTPTPAPDEVQIAIKYAAINPVDWKIAEGMLKTRMEYTFPITLGWDASGVISAVGNNVTSYKVGDEVFAYCKKEIMHDGAFAQFICLPAQNVAHKPTSLSFAEAAAVPLCSLTAWQALHESAKLKKGETILIQAGAGGVGSFAIQFAKQIGAHIITTARTSNHDYVKMLGADEAIDYTQTNVTDYPHNLDVLFDCAGGDTLTASYPLVKEGGRLITIAGVIDQLLADKYKLKTDFVFVQPSGAQLKQIAQLIDDGTITAPRVQEMPFERVETALNKSREGHVQGKMVLQM